MAQKTFEGVVRKRTRAVAANTSYGVGGRQSEFLEQKSGDQPAAVHAVLADDVDVRRRRAGFAASSAGRIGHSLFNSPKGRRYALSVNEYAGDQAKGRGPVFGWHIAGGVDKPAAGERLMPDLVAPVAVRAAHPDVRKRT